MRAYALAELGDSESIDLFLREEDARRALAECLADEPEWAGLPYVEPVELDERGLSQN
jgi:predicted ATPase